MTIYIDNDYKCHTASGDSLTAIETDFFAGKCQDYIEGYRFVPAGESWTRFDGAVFSGEMIAPWKPWQELSDAQAAYERKQLAEYEEALKIMGVSL